MYSFTLLSIHVFIFFQFKCFSGFELTVLKLWYLRSGVISQIFSSCITFTTCLISSSSLFVVCKELSFDTPYRTSKVCAILANVVTDLAIRVAASWEKFEPIERIASLHIRTTCSLCKSNGMLLPAPPWVLTKRPQVSWLTRCGGNVANWTVYVMPQEHTSFVEGQRSGEGSIASNGVHGYHLPHAMHLLILMLRMLDDKGHMHSYTTLTHTTATFWRSRWYFLHLDCLYLTHCKQLLGCGLWGQQKGHRSIHGDPSWDALHWANDQVGHTDGQGYHGLK